MNRQPFIDSYLHSINSNEDKDGKIEASKLFDLYHSIVSGNEHQCFSGFLDPVRASHAFKLISKSFADDMIDDAKVFLYGGVDEQNDNAGGYSNERRMLGLFSRRKDSAVSKLFPIDCLLITFNTKYGSVLSHRDYLGAFMSLGLERERIGDIILQNNSPEGASAFCFVHNQNSEYILHNLTKIGRNPVTVSLIDSGHITQLHASQQNKEETIIVSSMRLDAIIGTVFKFSRSKAKTMIESGKVFVNWIPLDEPDHILKDCDTVTLRGSGRFRILTQQGKSKKNKLIVRVMKWN